jgi:hypothetical protein
MDIVERLRVRNAPYGRNELMDKAADEIEALRDTVMRLKDELAEARQAT